MTTTRDANRGLVASLNQRINSLTEQRERYRQDRQRALDVAKIAQEDLLEAQARIQQLTAEVDAAQREVETLRKRVAWLEDRTMDTILRGT